MIVIGSFISGLAPFWICFGNFYWAVAAFMMTLSLGEAIYSPRVYEYTMEVAGRGAEGIYTSLASAPLFSVKLIVGGMSGWLLQKYCPAKGHRRSREMWAIIGFTSFVAPVLMWLLREVIHPSDPDEVVEKQGEYEVVDTSLLGANGKQSERDKLISDVIVENADAKTRGGTNADGNRRKTVAIEIGDN
mmetsp:Transcript_5383/g.14452  ORF Transcript_5383/g.14452 Transcript_5383/m.14452 type:complete len:189 (-) Transcript_5383:262-828(-)